MESLVTKNLTWYHSFSSPGSAALDLGYEIIAVDKQYGFDHQGDVSEVQHAEVLCQAFKFIRGHPLLANFNNFTSATGPFLTARAGSNALRMKRVVERSTTPLEEDIKAAIVELAKPQHTLGAPFDRVLFLTGEPSMEMVERLQPWVGDTYFYQETIESDDDDLFQDSPW